MSHAPHRAHRSRVRPQRMLQRTFCAAYRLSSSGVCAPMSSGFRIPAVRFHPLSLWEDDNPAKPSPSTTGQMAADGRDGQIGISWSGPPALLNHWARSGRHGLDARRPGTHGESTPRALVKIRGFIANNRRPRQLLRTYRSSHYDSCGERAEMIVNGFHFKSGTKG